MTIIKILIENIHGLLGVAAARVMNRFHYALQSHKSMAIQAFDASFISR